MKHDTRIWSLDTSVEGDIVATHTFWNANHVLCGKITPVDITFSGLELTKTKLRECMNAQIYQSLSNENFIKDKKGYWTSLVSTLKFVSQPYTFISCCHSFLVTETKIQQAKENYKLETKNRMDVT